MWLTPLHEGSGQAELTGGSVSDLANPDAPQAAQQHLDPVM